MGDDFNNHMKNMLNVGRLIEENSHLAQPRQLFMQQLRFMHSRQADIVGESFRQGISLTQYEIESYQLMLSSGS